MVIRVACVGDSITHGDGVTRNQTYPQVLQGLLGAGYDVHNLGASGMTMSKTGMSDGGPGSYWDTAQYQTLINGQWDIVVVMLGTNDSKAAIDKPTCLLWYVPLICAGILACGLMALVVYIWWSGRQTPRADPKGELQDSEAAGEPTGMGDMQAKAAPPRGAHAVAITLLSLIVVLLAACIAMGVPAKAYGGKDENWDCLVCPCEASDASGGEMVQQHPNCEYIKDYAAMLQTIKATGVSPSSIFAVAPAPLMRHAAMSMRFKVINEVLPQLIPQISAANGLTTAPISVFGALQGPQIVGPQTPTGCRAGLAWYKAFAMKVCDGDGEDEHTACNYFCDSTGINCDNCHPNVNGYNTIAMAVYNAIV